MKVKDLVGLIWGSFELFKYDPKCREYIADKFYHREDLFIVECYGIHQLPKEFEDWIVKIIIPVEQYDDSTYLAIAIEKPEVSVWK